MKKIFILLSLFCFSLSLFAAPSWVTDAGIRKVFPESEYISALGTAFNEESAKNKAAQAILQYIQTEVLSSTKSRYSEHEKGGSGSEEKYLEEEISLISNSNLYALEYTEIWKDEDSRYYCVAFIEKEAAWKIVNQKLSKIQTELSFLTHREIDLADLSKAEGIFLYQIMTTGIKIKISPSVFVRYLTKALCFKEDFLPTIEHARQEKIRRFVNG